MTVLTDFTKKRLMYEVDSIKQNILTRSMFDGPYLIWTVYRCMLSKKEFATYCLELVKILKNENKYDVARVDAKVESLLVLRIKFR